jgi:hypothetical protein
MRYRGNVSTESLSSNDRGTFTQPLPSSDKGFLPSRYLATIRGIHRQQRDLLSLRLFFQNEESRLKLFLYEIFYFHGGDYEDYGLL